MSGENEFVEGGRAEEDQDATDADAGVEGGVQWVVDDGAADESRADEITDVAEVAGEQSAFPGCGVFDGRGAIGELGDELRYGSLP